MYIFNYIHASEYLLCYVNTPPLHIMLFESTLNISVPVLPSNSTKVCVKPICGIEHQKENFYWLAFWLQLPASDVLMQVSVTKGALKFLYIPRAGIKYAHGFRRAPYIVFCMMVCIVSSKKKLRHLLPLKFFHLEWNPIHE